MDELWKKSIVTRRTLEDDRRAIAHVKARGKSVADHAELRLDGQRPESVPIFPASSART